MLRQELALARRGVGSAALARSQQDTYYATLVEQMYARVVVRSVIHVKTFVTRCVREHVVQRFIRLLEKDSVTRQPLATPAPLYALQRRLQAATAALKPLVQEASAKVPVSPMLAGQKQVFEWFHLAPAVLVKTLKAKKQALAAQSY